MTQLMIIIIYNKNFLLLLKISQEGSSSTNASGGSDGHSLSETKEGLRRMEVAISDAIECRLASYEANRKNDMSVLHTMIMNRCQDLKDILTNRSVC